MWTEIEVWNSVPVPGADISNSYISWIDREGPWHLSAGSRQTHTHKLSNHVLSATSADIAVQLRFRPTHFPHMKGEACNLQVIGIHSSLPTAHWFPLWTRWCIPTSLLAHWRTVCSQVYPISLSLCYLAYHVFHFHFDLFNQFFSSLCPHGPHFFALPVWQNSKLSKLFITTLIRHKKSAFIVLCIVFFYI